MDKKAGDTIHYLCPEYVGTAYAGIVNEEVVDEVDNAGYWVDLGLGLRRFVEHKDIIEPTETSDIKHYWEVRPAVQEAILTQVEQEEREASYCEDDDDDDDDDEPVSAEVQI